MNATSSLSETLGRFALAFPASDIPEDVQRNAWLHLIDGFGVGLMVSRTRYADALARYLQADDTQGVSTVWGMGKASLPAALLVNGSLTGAINYDDTHNESQLHPGAHLVPLAIGLGERRRLPGASVVAALALGNEIACRLACVAPGALARRGMHSSSVLGKAYCALMAARMLGLDLPAAVSAVGHAASQAGGTMQCYLDGSWTLAFHHGWTATSGLYAAQLGQAGFIGPREALDGALGLFNAFTTGLGVTPDYERAAADLGGHWESRAMSFKPYATGCVIHPFIDATLELARRHRIDAARVTSVTAVIADYLVPIVCEPLALKRRPADVFNARVSLPFILASTLRDGRFDLDSLSAESLADPSLLALAERVHYEIDPEAVPRRHFQARLRIEMDDGRVLRHHIVPWLRMHVGEESTPSEVQEKFLDNVGRVCARPEKILSLAQALRDDLTVDRFLDETQHVLSAWPVPESRTLHL